MLNFTVDVTFPKKKRLLFIAKAEIYSLQIDILFFFVSLHKETGWKTHNLDNMIWI